MIPKISLRIASLLLLLHLLGHSIGHSGWKKAADPEKAQVIKMMTGPKFPFMGVDRSMGEYFEGYGYIASIALLLMAIILWIVSGSVAIYNRPIRPIMLTLGLAILAIAGLEFEYFFPFAAGLSLLAGALTLVAWLKTIRLSGFAE